MPLILLKTKKKKQFMEFYIEKVYCNMKSCFLQNVFKRPKRLKMDILYSFRERKCIQCLFSFLIKTLKSIENYKKSDFQCKIIFFSFFSFKSSKSPKNIEKRVINAVLEKNIYIVVNKDKSINICNLCNFREKKYCQDKECIFLVFFHQQ